MRYRLRVAVGLDDVGRRVTIRSRLPDGKFSDVVGVLEACDAETFTVRDRRGVQHELPRIDVVAARVVREARG